MEKRITIFTDGASKGNPGPGGWGAVIIFGEKNDVTELGGGEKNTTNNRMELTGAIEALAYVSTKSEAKNYSVILHTDSSYVINGITKWVKGWQLRSWKTSQKEDVLNQDLWKKLAAVIDEHNLRVEWKYVGGHVGIAGNERVDEIATTFAEGRKPDLYHGTLSSYGIDVLNISHNSVKSAAKSGSSARSKMKAYSYVSMVGGKIETHKTWTECEARVKGKSGAKFKKAVSSAEEQEIINSWRKL